MSKLFEPFSLRSVTFRNRLFIAPMCQYSAEGDGKATDWHLVHLGARAIGGAGLVCVEATAVEARGRISPRDLGLWADEQVEPLARVARFVEGQGAVAAVQLAHAGRKASVAPPWEGGQWVSPDRGGWLPAGPSAIAFGPGSPEPHAMGLGEIAEVVGAFRAAAVRAHAAGFRVAEIHAAHGYLLHQFLSPLSNHRTDRYGGSFENRIRLALEVAAAVREVWPEALPLFARFSCTDWVEGGWSVEESVELSRRYKALGVDLIDCSSGALVPTAKIPVGPGFQVPFARRVREEAGVPTVAVGLITTAAQAEEVLTSGAADAVMIARESLRDPQFPLHAAHELGDAITWPRQYERGRPA